LLPPFHVCMSKTCLMMANSVLLRKSIEERMKPLSQCRQGYPLFCFCLSNMLP
jgi:hypothetical protein